MSSVGATFDALADFRGSLGEIKILCDAAKTFKDDKEKYATFNKAALLFIAGKFESFVESIVEEFVFRINKSGVPSDKISDVIRLHHSFHALREFENDQFKGKQKEAISLLLKLGKLWGTKEAVANLKIEYKFNYGKHGHVEMSKLFERIGIADLFDAVKLIEPIETISTDNPVINKVDFRGIFNSVCSMRNNILHEDASPSLNTEEIEKFKNQFEQFAIQLAAHLIGLIPS